MRSSLSTARGAASMLLLLVTPALPLPAQEVAAHADLILVNGRITTMDPRRPQADAVAIAAGRFVAVGAAKQVLRHRTTSTRVIDLRGRRVIPGLNDSHLHVLRGGLNYALEVRWDGVRSLAQALAMLRAQAARTPPGQWVRVVGGWSELQFRERRLPTLDELNAVAPEVPVFVLHLYDKALLNRAALRAAGIGRDTPNPPEGEIQRDAGGEPTGLMLARPGALILSSTLDKAPALDRTAQLLSTRHWLRELNRFGLTSAMDAGGGGQDFPDDYVVAEELARNGQLTLRIAYDLHTQRPGRELADYQRWATMTAPGRDGDRFRVDGYVMDGAGENLLRLAADYENFLEPRPELAPAMEDSLHRIVSFLVRQRWPLRIHGTYDESIARFLDVFERVDREERASARPGLRGLRWTIDHAETVSDSSLRRIARLGGRVAVQSRMAMQAEYFRDRYGRAAAARTPPVRRMLDLGVPVGLGSDGTRVNGYNPWVTLGWLVTGTSLGGYAHLPRAQRLTRMEALALHTEGSARLAGDAAHRGRIVVGFDADLAALSADYFTVPADRIARIESVLTIVGGDVVYGTADFAGLAPELPALEPAWSPVNHFGGYGAPRFLGAPAGVATARTRAR